MIVSTKIAHENAELLAAQDFAADKLWQVINSDIASLSLKSADWNKRVKASGSPISSVSNYVAAIDGKLTVPPGFEKTLAEDDAPQLYYEGSPAKYGLCKYAEADGSLTGDGCSALHVILEFGPENRRRSVHFACKRSTLIERGVSQ